MSSSFSVTVETAVNKVSIIFPTGAAFPGVVQRFPFSGAAFPGVVQRFPFSGAAFPGVVQRFPFSGAAFPGASFSLS
jgi:hypothetical protein